MTTALYNSIIHKLNKFAKARHITVTYANRFAYDVQDQELFLNSKCKNKIKFISYYLHELGHAIQNDSYFHKLKYKSYIIKRSIILEQEYTAWVNGYHIASNLNILKAIVKDYLLEWGNAWSTYFELQTHQLNNIYTGYIPEGRPPYISPPI
jgi:hypothetical protein